MRHWLIAVVGLAALCGCSNKGKALAEQGCACNAAAGGDVAKLRECGKLGVAAVRELGGDPEQLQAYLERMSACVVRPPEP